MKELNEMLSESEMEEFRLYKAKKVAEEQMKSDMETYKQLVNDEVNSAIPVLLSLSEDIKDTKKSIYENFKSIIDMKTEVLHVTKDNQRTHTFTNATGDKRVILGVCVTDGYRDTVEEGIEIIKDTLERFADDKKSKALIKMVFRLLARDAKGTLKASRIVQLRKLADELGDSRFMEGIRIIEDAYQPAVSKTFVRAELKDANGAWTSVPLGMTEA
ncbi:hypothetical protein EZS27_001391 [termite gut metagenome]|uniref:DUF3164 family protein n=1 Tax=termite gut metagenome TaxID=433724 RepID=A0A5J4T1C8_9ZZZZ